MDTETAETVQRVRTLAERPGNTAIIALAGVPGTGKSYCAFIAAKAIARHPLFLRQLQFHQSYAYEDFIEGLRPTSSGGFEPRTGVFLEWNEAALRDPQNCYVLLIEEFTRANIASVMGELLTFVEHRDRQFVLPITGKRMQVAPNVTIITTFNPMDRTAIELDDAMIRRMEIISCPPSPLQLRTILGPHFKDAPGIKILDELCLMFDELRKIFPESYEQVMPFGHGIFKDVRSEADLYSLWQHRLKYLLRRPHAPAHPFCEEIERLYRWRPEKNVPQAGQP